MTKYIMRLDDACEWRDVEKWNHIEELLDKYSVKPLVGVIPCCEDLTLRSHDYDSDFWDRVKKWQEKGWEIALHGCTHVYGTECGGINPVNARSEFAGEPFEIQADKIRRGVAVMHEREIVVSSFFAPSHTFDENTLAALRAESEIRVISDTVAMEPYEENGFVFVPQQSGSVRDIKLPLVTFCYHPNMMDESDFVRLNSFLAKHSDSFTTLSNATKLGIGRRRNLMDRVLSCAYFVHRSLKRQ